MQEMRVIIPAGGISFDVDSAVPDATLVDLVTAVGDVIVTLDGSNRLTMRQLDVKQTQPFRRLRLEGTAQTVVLHIGQYDEVARHGGLFTGGGGTVTPAESVYVGQLGVNSGSVSSIPSVPLTKKAVNIFVSLDPTAPGPVFLGLSTALGGSKGLMLMPGTTSPPLQVAPVNDTSSRNVYVYNPNGETVTVYSYCEYIN